MPPIGCSSGPGTAWFDNRQRPGALFSAAACLEFLCRGWILRLYCLLSLCLSVKCNLCQIGYLHYFIRLGRVGVVQDGIQARADEQQKALQDQGGSSVNEVPALSSEAGITTERPPDFMQAGSGAEEAPSVYSPAIPHLSSADAQQFGELQDGAAHVPVADTADQPVPADDAADDGANDSGGAFEERPDVGHDEL